MPGGGGPQQTQTTTANLSPEQHELLGLAMPGLKSFAQNGVPMTPFSTVSPFNPTETAGQGAVLGSTGAQSDIVGSAGGASKFLTSGDALDPNTNPGLRGTIDAATRPIYQHLTEDTLPAIRGEAIQSGNYGGSRQGIAEGIAARGASTAAGDVGSKVAFSGYNAGLDAMLKALGLAPGTAASQSLPGQTTSAVGDFQRQLEQQQLTEAGQRFQYPYLEPYEVGSALAGIAGGLPGGSTTTTGQSTQPLSLAQMLTGGGAIGSAVLGSQGISSMLPMLAALSDERIKTDVRKVGEWQELPVYEFRYFGRPTVYQGLMAQDVERRHPEAVLEVVGIKAIDYGKLEEIYGSI